MSNFEIFPEKQPPPPPPPPHPLDDLFTKVASLWLWTVFFVVTSGLSFSFLSSLNSMLAPMFSSGWMGRGGGGAPMGGMNGDMIAFVIPVVHIAGMIANVGSWAFLYLYFTVYLLPAVILRDPNGVDDRRRRIATAALRRTYLLTIAAGIARMLPELILYLGPALSRMI